MQEEYPPQSMSSYWMKQHLEIWPRPLMGIIFELEEDFFELLDA